MLLASMIAAPRGPVPTAKVFVTTGTAGIVLMRDTVLALLFGTTAKPLCETSGVDPGLLPTATVALRRKGNAVRSMTLAVLSLMQSTTATVREGSKPIKIGNDPTVILFATSSTGGFCDRSTTATV